MRFRMMVVAVASVLLVVGSGWGQTPEVFEDQHLTASDSTAGAYYGVSVSVSSTVVIVGSYGRGTAYIYRFDGTTWVEESQLFPFNGVGGGGYGISVSISGNVAIVGAWNENTGGGNLAGAAYIYRFDGASWVEEAHLIAPDGAESDFFGESVSINGTVAIVGAYRDDTAVGIDAGSVFVYRFNGTSWVEELHLFASDEAAGDAFGSSVSVSGNIIFVGASLDDTAGGTNTGSAYIYRFNGTTWEEELHLIASDGTAGDRFGESVSIIGPTDGEVAIVGAAGDDPGGSAYVYRFDGVNWAEEAYLSASDGVSGDQFGESVSVSGTVGNEVAVVGAIADDTTGGFNAGSAYVYRFNGTNWLEEKHLLASDGAANDLFGRCVTISGEVIFAGAEQSDTVGGVDAGSAYVYYGTSDCNANGINDLTDIVSGFSSDLNYNGIPDDCDPDCNGNSIPDFLDIDFGISTDCDLNGIPDECDPDCNGNGQTDACDISFGTSNDVNGNGIPDECEPDCNGNLIPDAFDIAINTSNDFNGNGTPDECEADCNGNGLPDFLDILLGVSEDINQNGVPDECELDCNGNGVWDSIDIVAGTSIDINGNLIPDECEADCNGNGVPDDWDIAIGTSVDINNDGIPDECKPDCNGNGIPDFLDIMFGASQDANQNGIPDECECPADITPLGGNGVVNIDDLVAVLNSFGPCGVPPLSCDADITPPGGNGVVNIDDLVAVLNGFGDCP